WPPTAGPRRAGGWPATAGATTASTTRAAWRRRPPAARAGAADRTARPAPEGSRGGPPPESHTRPWPHHRREPGEHLEDPLGRRAAGARAARPASRAGRGARAGRAPARGLPPPPPAPLSAPRPRGPAGPRPVGPWARGAARAARPDGALANEATRAKTSDAYK